VAAALVQVQVQVQVQVEEAKVAGKVADPHGIQARPTTTTPACLRPTTTFRSSR
jgi:hypothetical protein